MTSCIGCNSNAENTVNRKELAGVLKTLGLRVEPSFRPPPLLSYETPASIPFVRIVKSLTIGAYSYIGRDSEIRSASIGRFCSIARRVVMAQEEHPTSYVSSHPISFNPQSYFSEDSYFRGVVERRAFTDRKTVEIGHDVWIGDRVCIRSGVKIGTGAIIGAGAVVVRDVEPYSIVGGVPSKLIRMRFSERLVGQLLMSQWWDYDITPLRTLLGDPARFVGEFFVQRGALTKLSTCLYCVRSIGADTFSISVDTDSGGIERFRDSSESNVADGDTSSGEPDDM